MDGNFQAESTDTIRFSWESNLMAELIDRAVRAESIKRSREQREKWRWARDSWDIHSSGLA